MSLRANRWHCRQNSKMFDCKCIQCKNRFFFQLKTDADMDLLPDDTVKTKVRGLIDKTKKAMVDVTAQLETGGGQEMKKVILDSTLDSNGF